MLRVYLLNQELNASTFTVYNNDGCGVVYKFAGGNVVTKTPASFMTDDPYFQMVLENSEYFKNGIVKFDLQTAKEVAKEKAEAAAKKSAEPVPVEPADDSSEEEDSGLVIEPDVKTVAEACNYVAEHFGLKVTKAAQAKAIARENGVDFVNLKIGKKG